MKNDLPPQLQKLLNDYSYDCFLLGCHSISNVSSRKEIDSLSRKVVKTREKVNKYLSNEIYAK